MPHFSVFITKEVLSNVPNNMQST